MADTRKSPNNQRVPYHRSTPQKPSFSPMTRFSAPLASAKTYGPTSARTSMSRTFARIDKWSNSTLTVGLLLS
jgi:hypothetical protein